MKTSIPFPPVESLANLLPGHDIESIISLKINTKGENDALSAFLNDYNQELKDKEFSEVGEIDFSKILYL